MTAIETGRRWLPGVGLLVALALAATVLGTAFEGPSPLLLAVGLGALVANGPGVPARAQTGVAAHALLLEVGIVLLGARLAFDELAVVGPRLLVLAAGVVAGGLVTVEVVSRIGTDMDRRVTSLLAAGAGVCGVAAAAAVARSIDADEHQLVYAATAVLLFDALTLAVFPVVGAAMALPEASFGVWVGLAMFSTGPATAVGFAAGATAGELATLAKLSRNALIGVVAAGYAVAYGRGTGGSIGLVRTAWASFPRFLVGFALVVVVANLGWLSPAAIARVEAVSDAAFLLAFAGLGLTLSIRPMRRVGLVPVAVVGVSLALVGSLALAGAVLWF